MKVLKYGQHVLLTGTLLLSLLGYSSRSVAQVLEKPAHLLAQPRIASTRQLYLAGPFYDGANTIGYFWPQLLSGPRNNTLWADAGLFGRVGAGLGYRHLLRPRLLSHQLCFAGFYGYLEWPNLYLNPYIAPFQYLAKPGSFFASIRLWDTFKYIRLNVALELGTPYVNITFNGYGFTQDHSNRILDRQVLQQELYGYSMRLSSNIIWQRVRPFFEISKSYVKTKKSGSQKRKKKWITTWAIGARAQLTDTVDFEIKGIHDLGQPWGFEQYHLPIHFGFYYNVGSLSQALPKGYRQLPERFIPHYPNALVIKRAVNNS